MGIRTDLLLACSLTNRWATSTTSAGVTTTSTISAAANVAPPSNYDSKHFIESLHYSIQNLTGVDATVTMQVRNSSPTGTVMAAVDHLVTNSTTQSVSLSDLGMPAKIGMGVSFTMTTVVGFVSQSINASGWTEDVSSTTIFDETYIRSLTPAAWYRYGVGITSSSGAVSQWSDQSGNGRHITQTGSTTAQPTVQADNSILFDGVDDSMATGAFTLNQPCTFYLLMQQVTWTSADQFFSGIAAADFIAQNPTTPQLRLNAGSIVGDNANFLIGSYAAVIGVYNGASSVLQINNTAPTTGDAGANNPGGLTLGAAAGGIASWANIQVKEVILFPGAHDATTRGRVISYLKKVGGLKF